MIAAVPIFGVSWDAAKPFRVVLMPRGIIKMSARATGTVQIRYCLSGKGLLKDRVLVSKSVTLPSAPPYRPVYDLAGSPCKVVNAGR